MPSRFVIGFMTFIFFTGSIIGIYAATQAQPTIYNPQANVNSAQLDAQRHNQAINQSGSNEQASNTLLVCTNGTLTNPVHTTLTSGTNSPPSPVLHVADASSFKAGMTVIVGFGLSTAEVVSVVSVDTAGSTITVGGLGQVHNQGETVQQTTDNTCPGSGSPFTTSASQGPIVGQCTSDGSIVSGIYCSIVNVGNFVKAQFQIGYCQLAANLGGNFNQCIGATNVGNVALTAATPIQQSVGSLFGASVTNTQSSNSWLDITGNPVSDALIITGIFLGLGLLAGLFGAGILANVIARVGITLSILYYFNAEMSIFGSVTDFFFVLLILAPLNVLIGIGSLAFILEAMGGGKES